jgi:hypothetical protein
VPRPDPPALNHTCHVHHRWQALLRSKRYHAAREALRGKLLLAQPAYCTTLQKCR